MKREEIKHCISVLFKYGSIQVILKLCRPLTANLSNRNIINVDDNLLTGKNSAYLESTDGKKLDLEQTAPRENGAYIVYWDYFQMWCTNGIATFIIDH